MAHKGIGETVTRQGLADVFGVAVTTVDVWRRRGCPAEKKGGAGRAWRYNTAAVHEWLQDQAKTAARGNAPSDEAELKLRKLAAEAEQKELELAKARGEVAPVDQMERMVSMAFAELRSHLRNMPSRMAPALLGETKERRFKRLMLAEIDQALDALADADLIGDDEDA